jgi:ComF family protein
VPSPALRSIRDGLLSLAYPQQCRICGNSVQSWDDGVACSQCWEDPEVTRILTAPICAKCGAPLSSTPRTNPDNFRSTENSLCGSCSNVPFAAARSCGIYSGALEASILYLKVNPHICPRLRRILLRTFFEHHSALKSDKIVPVPLHKLRQRQRGFNQAAIIARLISKESGLPIDNHLLRRIKATERHRAGMDAHDRNRSVERAFEVVLPGSIEGRSVLLIDDVYTTGSTISAACSSLLSAGARQVSVLTIARVGYR